VELPARFSKAELFDRAALRVAAHIRGLLEEKGSSDTRLLEALFIPDELTVVGRSRACVGEGHREHVVPRRVVIKECHRMIETGATDAEVARFIRDTVRIVRISDEERRRLDSRDQLGLRQEMPAGWKIGGDLFARLKAAQIEWEPINSSDEAAQGDVPN
jgi:hypothetical protein